MRTKQVGLLAVVLCACAQDPADSKQDLEGMQGHMLVSDYRGRVEEVTYVVHQGRAIYDGDIDLGPVDLARLSTRGLAATSLSRRWPDNTIHYQYSTLPAGCPANGASSECSCNNYSDPATACTDLDPGSEYGTGERATVREALDEFEQKLGLKFVRGIPSSGPYFTFAHTGTNGVTHPDAFDNNDGFPVQVTLASFSKRTILHEVGHVLGLSHEQKRPDATTINVNPLCMSDAAQFNPSSLSSNEYLTPFDTQSVMMYESFQKSLSEYICSSADVGVPGSNCCPALMKKNGSNTVTFHYTAPATGIQVIYNNTAYAATPNQLLTFTGDYIPKSTDLSVEDLNALRQMYPPQLGIVEAGDRFGATAATGDFDNDGYQDLAVSAPHEAPGDDPAAGGVLLYKGTYTGLEPWAVLREDSSGVDEEDDDLFGSALATGDINSDGWNDLVVGAPSKRPSGGTQRAGAIYLFLGSADGLAFADFVYQSDVGYLNATGDDFGKSLDIAQVMSGKQVLVGSPGTMGGGRVYVLGWSGSKTRYHGSGTGTVILKTRIGSDQTSGSKFGRAVRAGQLDSDSWDDIVVGAPGADFDGRIFLFKGGSSGVTFLGHISNPDNMNTDLDNAGFGHVIRLGHFRNSSGKHQIAVGAPDDNKGAVYIFEVTLSASAVTVDHTQTLQPWSMDMSAEFGNELATGDVNGDGLTDLAIGAPQDFNMLWNAGIVYVYYGKSGSSGSDPLDDFVYSSYGEPGGHGGPGQDANFGSALAIGNFNNKGERDIAIGAAGKAPSGTSEYGAGAVYVLKGRSNDTPTFAEDEHDFTTYFDQGSQSHLQK